MAERTLEIATAYLLRYGSFDFEIIPTLIVKLLRADLLTMRPVSRLRAVPFTLKIRSPIPVAVPSFL